MDPNTTLAELADALADGDWERVAELADALAGWLDAGGYVPAPYERGPLVAYCWGCVDRARAELDPPTRRRIFSERDAYGWHQ